MHSCNYAYIWVLGLVLRYTTLLKGHLNAGDVDAGKALLESMGKAGETDFCQSGRLAGASVWVWIFAVMYSEVWYECTLWQMPKTKTMVHTHQCPVNTTCTCELESQDYPRFSGLISERDFECRLGSGQEDSCDPFFGG